MKIGIIAHVKHAICEPFAGGLEAHTAYLAKALIAKGHTVTLFSAEDEVTDSHFEFFCKQTVELALSKDGGFEYEHRAYQNLMHSLHERDFDLIHNNSLHYLPVAMSGQLSIPMVTTLHTPPFWELAGSIRLSRDTNSVFVAVSECIRKSWSAVTDVDYTIPNGVDLERFRFAPQPSGAPYLFWSGRIVPEKGLHLAIEAANLAKIPLLFAGPISDPEYFEVAIRKTLGNSVQYLGHLGHDRLIDLMGAAKACICTPVWDEPFGLVVAEALACGTPVAGFARGALPDLIDSGSGILVEPDNVQALASAMHAVQNLSCQDCRAQATRICDDRRMIDAYESVYERICRTPRLVPRRITQPEWYSGLVNRELLKSYYLLKASLDLLVAEAS